LFFTPTSTVLRGYNIEYNVVLFWILENVRWRDVVWITATRYDYHLHWMLLTLLCAVCIWWATHVRWIRWNVKNWKDERWLCCCTSWDHHSMTDTPSQCCFIQYAVLYLLRSPFYDRYSKSVLLHLIRSVIPLEITILWQILQVSVASSNTQCYTSWDHHSMTDTPSQCCFIQYTVLYLLRSPFYDRYSKSVMLHTIHSANVFSMYMSSTDNCSFFVWSVLCHFSGSLLCDTIRYDTIRYGT